jgi:serine/threonine protein kinase
LPGSGFKLHLTASLDEAARLLSIVVPLCVAERTQFKVLCAANLLALFNSKSFPRAAAHKFVTIYPLTVEVCRRLAAALDEATRDFAGPHILSDRPFNHSKVVFYRFGGFSPITRLSPEGVKEYWMQTPDGSWCRDTRLPYFHLPDGVQDPLSPTRSAPAPGPVTLRGRYRVTEALAFSTCGGTYVADDLKTNQTVLIKEARPLTLLWHNPTLRYSASECLRREERVLRKLEGLNCVARPLGSFQEGGHEFWVQDFIRARVFRQYRATDRFALTPYEDNAHAVRQFCDAFRKAAQSLIEAVLAIHSRGIIIGDISPDNLLVGDSGEIYVIDLGAAWDFDWGAKPDGLTNRWMTPGFRRSGSSMQSLTYDDDWFAVSVVLFSMLLPVEPFTVLLPGARRQFMHAIVRSSRLPCWVSETIEALDQGMPLRALAFLDITRETAQMRESSAERDESQIEAEGTRTIEAASATVLEIIDYLSSQYSADRAERLWPSDYKIFQTNPLSIAYGACGPLLLLNDFGVQLPDDIRTWLLSHELRVSEYTPSLYLGLSGIAYTYWRLGLRDQATHALSLAFESDLLYASPGLFLGAAGCGLVSLQMYLWTRDERFVAQAATIGSRLLESADEAVGGIAWHDPLTNHYASGYAHGSSGIGLFLLYLGQITRDGGFIRAARRALDHALGTAIQDCESGLRRWKPDPRANLWSPYWLHGGCGIGSAVIRFYRELKEERYREVAREIASSNYSRFTVSPSQFEGLSGIGEFLLDMSAIDGDRDFASKAARLAESILLYRVPTARGTEFPGRYLVRLSTDFGYGSAGVGAFLARFVSRRTRGLHDLEGMHPASATCQE